MYESFLDRDAHRADADRAAREAEERKKREEEERKIVDAHIPPETETSFETLLEAVPNGVRQRLERAKSILGRREIPPADRISHLADTLEVIRRFLNGRVSVAGDEYKFRKFLYDAAQPSDVWLTPLEISDWLGTDANDEPVKRRVKETCVETAKSVRAGWRASEQLIRSAFPGQDWYAELASFEEELRNTGLELLQTMEAKEPPEFLAGFHPDIQRAILRNTFTIELTEGCSVRCTFCAFDAAPGVRGAMPFETALWLLRRTKDIFLYYATDPLDYRVNADGIERTYADVLDAFIVLHESKPFTSTAVPVKSMDVLKQTIDRIHRISFSSMNERRLIKTGYIERTDGGTYFPTDGDLAWRFWNILSNEEYFLPEINRLATTKNEGIATILASGRQKNRSHEEGHANGDTVADSIACRDGVVVSPTQVKNSVRMMTTDAYPNGLAEAALTPENLNNGTDVVERLIAELDAGRAVMINQLLPHVVISFADSYTRLQKNARELVESISFKTFRTDGRTVSPVTGKCAFDRISGRIRSVTIPRAEPAK